MANFLYSNREQKFLLNEWLETQKIWEAEPYNEYLDADAVDMILDELIHVAKDKVAPTNLDGDRIGAQMVDGSVKLPKSYHELYHFLQENGYGSNESDPNDEMKLPQLLRVAQKEFFMAANPSFTYAELGAGSALLIVLFGTEEYKKMFVPYIYSGVWTGTMALTEPNAGSDAGEAVTKAIPTDVPGVYKIKGVKSFITGGDHDLTENIIHLLLARVEGAAPGSKGLSLFIVPKMKVDTEGHVLSSNDVTTLSLEHKMGLKGSSTVMLSFGDHDDCEGYLLGNPPDEKGVGQGMMQMFVMMNAARQGTGVKAIGIAQAACNYSVQYAKERIQGKPAGQKGAPRVPIIKHADVKRMLMDQKAVLEAARAIVYKATYYQDLASISTDAKFRKYCNAMVDFANPIEKAYPTDVAWDTIEEAIQVHGGYGYMEEYPVAQCARDEKVLSIWEGTSFIQAQDLVNRKWRLGDGIMLKMWNKEISDSLKKSEKADAFAAEVTLLSRAHAAHMQIQQAILSATDPNFSGLYATRALHATAQVWGGVLLLEQAVLANEKLSGLSESDADYEFYRGKILTAKYYIHNVVPNVFCTAEIIKDGDLSALEISEDVL